MNNRERKVKCIRKPPLTYVKYAAFITKYAIVRVSFVCLELPARGWAASPADLSLHEIGNITQFACPSPRDKLIRLCVIRRGRERHKQLACGALDPTLSRNNNQPVRPTTHGPSVITGTAIPRQDPGRSTVLVAAV